MQQHDSPNDTTGIKGPPKTGGEVSETVRFVKMMDCFFDCLNVNNYSRGRKQGNYSRTHTGLLQISVLRYIH